MRRVVAAIQPIRIRCGTPLQPRQYYVPRTFNNLSREEIESGRWRDAVLDYPLCPSERCALSLFLLDKYDVESPLLSLQNDDIRQLAIV